MSKPSLVVRPPRRLHVVTGKGGVGKSTVAAALALAAARRGRRVLAIELDEPGGLCRIFGRTPAAAGVIADSERGVALAWFDGAAALAEYLLRKVRLGSLARPLLEHPLYRAFVEAAPGVRELLAMGKVRDEVVLQRDGARPRWDVVVLDAGSSGHALEHLRMPAAAARAFRSGRVHREAARNAAFLRDATTTVVHVVALGEEMPLREAAQVVAALRGSELAAIGAVLVNQCRPPAPAGVDVAVTRLPAGAIADELVRARGWERIQEAGIAGFEAETGEAVVRLPWLPLGADGLARASALAEAVGEATL
jgi:anion-transporting  ArsA/GET3 family ATPase